MRRLQEDERPEQKRPCRLSSITCQLTRQYLQYHYRLRRRYFRSLFPLTDLRFHFIAYLFVVRPCNVYNRIDSVET